MLSGGVAGFSNGSNPRAPFIDCFPHLLHLFRSMRFVQGYGPPLESTGLLIDAQQGKHLKW